MYVYNLCANITIFILGDFQVKRRVPLNVRLFLVTMCIALPIILALFFTGTGERKSARNEKITELQSEIEVEMSKVDTQLRFLRNSLVNLAIDDSYIGSVASGDENSTEFWLNNQKVLEKINNQTAEIDSGFTVFIYYPNNDLFYNYKKDTAVSDFVRKQIEDKVDLSVYSQWSTVWCDDEPYLFFMLDYDNYYIGAWGSYESLISNLRQSSEGTAQSEILEKEYLICDENGQVIMPTEKQETTLSFDDNIYSDDDNKSWYYVGTFSENSDFYLVKQVSKQLFDSQLPEVNQEISVIAILFAVLFIVYVICLYIWILKPMNYLKKSMAIIQQGNLDYRISYPKNSSVEFDAVIEEFNVLMDNISDLKIQMYEDQLERKETELQYLSRQIQPHFILNTLNSIYNYSERDVKTTKQLIKLTSDYYRYVVNVNSRYVKLSEELSHIEDYMRLQKMRYPNAFDYKVNCDDELRNVPIPPFIIESFVGNAIKHGLKPNELTEIDVTVTILEDEKIQIQIKDNGVGFSDDSLDATLEFLSDGTVSEELGVGIRNSVARLRLIYGDKCDIRIYNAEPSGAVVEIILDYHVTEQIIES